MLMTGNVLQKLYNTQINTYFNLILSNLHYSLLTGISILNKF